VRGEAFLRFLAEKAAEGLVACSMHACHWLDFRDAGVSSMVLMVIPAQQVDLPQNGLIVKGSGLTF
jgi:hypothetical protein